jgi:hypothetical protein
LVVPTLFRLFTILVVLAALVGAAMVYLGNFVTPQTRQMSVPVVLPPASQP